MRYARQEQVIGKKGQETLSQSRIAILGLGAIGSVAAEMLARSGADLILIDRDIVEESNLSRQWYEEKDLDVPKALALQQRLRNINSSVKIDAVFDDFNAANAVMLLRGVDFAIDGFDNLYSRFLLNDACLTLGIPFTYAAAVQARGLCAVIIPRRTACLRCFLPYSQGRLETCEAAGILAPVSGTVGMLAALEAIKFLAGFGKSCERLLSIDFENNEITESALKQIPGCPACAGRYEFLSEAMQRTPVVQLCGAGSYYVALPQRIDAALFKKIAGMHGNDHVAHVRFGRRDVTLFAHGRMIVRNASSEKEARSVAEKLLSF